MKHIFLLFAFIPSLLLGQVQYGSGSIKMWYDSVGLLHVGDKPTDYGPVNWDSVYRKTSAPITLGEDRGTFIRAERDPQMFTPRYQKPYYFSTKNKPGEILREVYSGSGQVLVNYGTIHLKEESQPFTSFSTGVDMWYDSLGGLNIGTTPIGYSKTNWDSVYTIGTSWGSPVSLTETDTFILRSTVRASKGVILRMLPDGDVIAEIDSAVVFPKMKSWVYKGVHCEYNTGVYSSNEYYLAFDREVDFKKLDQKVPGIVDVFEHDRYSITVHVGIMFDAKASLKAFIDSETK